MHRLTRKNSVGQGIRCLLGARPTTPVKGTAPKDEAVAADLPAAAKPMVAAHVVTARLHPAVLGESATAVTARADAAMYRAESGDRNTAVRI